MEAIDYLFRNAFYQSGPSPGQPHGHEYQRLRKGYIHGFKLQYPDDPVSFKPGKKLFERKKISCTEPYSNSVASANAFACCGASERVLNYNLP